MFIKALIVTAILSVEVFACGTLDTWIDAYNGKGVHADKNKKFALVGIYKCGRFHYKRQDAKLLPVLLDASKNIYKIDANRNSGFADQAGKYRHAGQTKLLLEEIFRRYNCLKYADKLPAYKNLLEIFDNHSCPNVKIEKMRVKVSNTAIIRSSASGDKIGYLKNGAIIHVISKKGPWIKIYVPGAIRDTERIGVGYMHKSLLVAIP